jgi:hypothetical protein
MNIERRAAGSIELRLSDDPDQFTFLAEAIRKKFAGRWTEQVDGLDQSYWDLDVQGKKITVHREHYLGVVVFCDDDAPGRLLLELLQRDFETGR